MFNRLKYMICWLTVSCSALAQSPPYKGTLHLLLFADAQSTDIKDICQTDRREMENWCQHAAERSHLHFRNENTAHLFSPESVIPLVDQMQVDSNDVVIFYYTGHGFRFLKLDGKFPYFSFYDKVGQKKLINLETLHKAILAKHARLTITLGDLCNTPIPGNVFVDQKGFASDRAFERLFLQARGSILAASCAPGEESYNSQEGNMSLYTQKLLAVFNFETQRTEEPDWENIFQQCARQTTLAADASAQQQHPIKQIQVNYHQR